MMLLMIQQVDALMMVTSCCKHQGFFFKTQLYLYRSETKISLKSSEIRRNSRNKPVHPGILGGMIQPCFYTSSSAGMEYSSGTSRYCQNIPFRRLNRYKNRAESYRPKYQGVPACFGYSGEFRSFSAIFSFRIGTNITEFFGKNLILTATYSNQ